MQRIYLMEWRGYGPDCCEMTELASYGLIGVGGIAVHALSILDSISLMLTAWPAFSS